jgi:signal transduction histidine kinase
MKTARQLSIFLLLISALSAYYASYQMIIDPTGNSLGLPFYLLNGTLLNSYSVVGWILLVSVAVFSSFSLIMIIVRCRFYSFLIILQGVIICIFVVMQMFLVGETFIIQYVSLIFGAGLIGLGILQNQRKMAVDIEKKVLREQKSHHHKHRKHR